MPRPLPRLIQVIAMALSCACTGCYQRGTAPEQMPATEHTAVEIMRANCGTCHGVEGQGGYSWVDPTWFAPELAGVTEAVVKTMVRMGRPPAMPMIPEHEVSETELTALAAYIAGLPANAVPAPAYDTTMFVLDEDPWFSPMQVSIQPGQTVRFVNLGRTYHPVADIAFVTSHGMDGIFSGNLGANGEYYHTFDTTGVFTLLCGMHPYMRGEVHVGTGTAPVPPTWVPAAPQPLPPVAGVGEIWVMAQFQNWPGKATDGVAQVIDAATFTVTNQIPVGNNPHNIWFGQGNNEALITNWFGVSVNTVDSATKLVTGEYIAGAAPAHVTSDYAGTNWYVSMEGSHYIQSFTQAPGIYGLGGFTLVTPRAVISGYGPHGVWYANGLLVSSNSMDNSFSIVDAASLTELATLPAGIMPLGASANSSATIGACGNAVSNSVSIYDISNRIYIRDIPTSGSTVQVPFTPNDQKIFAATGSGVTIIDAMRAINASTWPDPASAIDTFIPTGRGAHGIAFGFKSGGGLYAYVSHKFTNYVSVIDVATQTHVGDIPLLTTTTGNVSLAGATDTGGNGISVRPNPAPWQ